MDIDRGFRKELFLDCVSWGVIACCFVQSCDCRLIFVNCRAHCVISSIHRRFFVCLAGCTGKGLSRPEFSVTTKQHQKYVPVKDQRIMVSFVTKKDNFFAPSKDEDDGNKEGDGKADLHLLVVLQPLAFHFVCNLHLENKLYLCQPNTNNIFLLFLSW